MKTLLCVVVAAAVLWWLSRRTRAAQSPLSNPANGTAPNSSGESLGDGNTVPSNVPNAFAPDPRDDDPVVKLAQAAGLDSSIIPVPTVAQAVARSQAGAASADALLALSAPDETYVTWDSNAGAIGFDGRHVGALVRLPVTASADQLAWEAAQQADVAANPYYASLGYNGDAGAVAGQVACGAKSSNNPMGRVLDSSFCKGGVHYDADAMLSTGTWP